MNQSVEARNLLREFNRDLERERQWKQAKDFALRWLWLIYLSGLVGCAWAIYGWLR